jgi:RHS repeat-associated protein
MQLEANYDIGQRFVRSCALSASLFTGKERDTESGNDYFGARYYASSMGRFMNPDDPFIGQSLGNPQSLNLYSYVQNNPLTNVDPDGHDCIHINNDTGAYEGTDSGDCDNSTEEKANSGYYVDGTVSTINENSSGQVTGYSGTSYAGNLMSGAFATPLPSSGGFDPGSLAAGLFGAAGAPYWNNAAGVVNTAGSLEMGVMAPWAGALAGCSSGGSSGSCAANLALSLLPEVGELRAGATLLKEAAAAGKGAEILQKAGGAAQAAKEFEALPAVSEQINGTVRVKTLSDGSKAVLYESSSGSGTTISLQDASGHTSTKIRY